MDILKQALKSSIFPTDSNQISKDEEMELTEKYYCKLKGIKEHASQSIPTFFKQPSTEDDTLFQKVRDMSRANLLESKSKDLLDNEELDNLWKILEENGVGPENDKVMDYTKFCQIKESVSAKCRKYFTPSVYASLSRISSPVPIINFFNFVMRKIWMTQTFLGLSLFDSGGKGYFMGYDLEGYLVELIPSLSQLSEMPFQFYPVYLYTVARKFFFFLDYNRRDVIKLTDIIASGFLDDFLELRDETSPLSDINWFSEESVRKVHEQFLELDGDNNGMLSMAEFSNINGGSLTKSFIERFFEVSVTYDGEIDYKTYLEFILAMENRNEERSLAYLFRIFDVENCGYLTDYNIYFFYKDIQEQMTSRGYQSIPVEHITNELLDMVSAGKTRKVTIKELVSSYRGATFFSVLIDFNEFLRFDNREILVIQNNDDFND